MLTRMLRPKETSSASGARKVDWAIDMDIDSEKEASLILIDSLPEKDRSWESNKPLA